MKGLYRDAPWKSPKGYEFLFMAACQMDKPPALSVPHRYVYLDMQNERM
jgi:hypothetical protein